MGNHNGIANHDLTQDTKYIGIRMVAVVMIVSSSVWFFSRYSDATFYKKVFDFYPASLISLRFVLSIIKRLAGVVCGVGVYFRREFFRKMAVIYYVIQIVTITWAHPRACFQKVATELMDKHKVFTELSITRDALSNIAWGVMLFSQIVFSAVIIFILCRPSVKRQFQ